MSIRLGSHIAVVTASLVLLGGCAREVAAPTPPSGTIAQNLITDTATVKKIDQRTRKVTLQLSDGSTRTIKVGQEVRNLPQVKAGDVVSISYYESIVYEVRRPGTAQPGVAVAQNVVRALPGERPGAGAAQVTTVTATIEAIDRKAGTVTLKGPDGESATIKPQDATVLDRVAVGEMVEFTLTEALAIAVEPPPK
jgi:Cu/Ag efflux protein CusF